MSQKFEKLKTLLKELFQLDQPDLDFGLYRIMHAKSAEVTQFLDRDLLPQVAQAFSLYKTADKAELEKELATAIAQAQALGADPETLPKVKELRYKLANEAVDLSALENEVYDRLYSFFRRYYLEGDFLAKRVYKPGVYAIPYEGEEVAHYWANRDQYYIKTSEYLRDYAFRLRPTDAHSPMRVHFRLVDAVEGEHGNIKAAEGKDRVFILAAAGETGRDFITEIDGEQGKELSIGFEYRPATLADWPEDVRAGKTKPPAKREELSAIAASRVLKVADSKLTVWLSELSKPNAELTGFTQLESHLRRYMARNTFDYFIHKDLGAFLSRELDFFIKNEVMHLDDVENETAPRVEQYLSKIKIIRAVARKIIAFLAQLEDFEKKLWLKKKFVVETAFLISISRIPEQFYAEVAANDAQREEWVQLLGIDALTSSYSTPLTTDFLKLNPTLMVNTLCFQAEFTERLLDAIGDLDQDTDGLLVHSENFQALNLMQHKCGSTIACVYIDPPYNTGQDGFAYKDAYKDSSWASMMHDRLQLARGLLVEKGVLFASINEIERATLEWQLREVFGVDNRIEEVIWVRDTMSNNSPTYSTNHEYVEVYSRNRHAVESDRSMFRESKPGFSEVMKLVESVRGNYPASPEIQVALRDLYQQHQLQHIEEARAQGQSKKDAIKSDPWKGLYPYRNVEYRDKQGHLVDDSVASECSAVPWVWREVEPSMPAGKQSASIKDPNSDNYRFYQPKHPVTHKPCKPPKRGWAFPQFSIGNRPSFEGYLKDDRILFRDSEKSIPQLKYFLHEVESIVSTSVIRQYADGEPKLEAIVGRKGLIDNPKPPGLIEKFVRQTTSGRAQILDFFGGSGTTAQAVIDANRRDGERRRFTVVEMEDYFNSVLLPRVTKIAFSPEWESGAFQRVSTAEEAKRGPGLIKVIRLESYEDTLNNLETRRTTTQQSLLEAPDAGGAGGFKEQFVLRYMLDVDTRGSQSLLNVQNFQDPTDYLLKVRRPGSDESREVNVDLLETFNWLIGLTVKHIAASQKFSAEFERDTEKRLRIKGRIKQDSAGPWWFRTVMGATPDGRRTLIIWRKLTGNPEQDNLVLDEWFTRQGYSTRDYEFQLIYVNDDSNLENLKTPDDTWKVRLIEEDFHRLMFDTEGV
jgi:adenine-specific DNA-methyltransferase